MSSIERSTLHDLAVELKAETPNAWLVNDGTIEAWVPKSQCELEQNRDGTYTLTLPKWLMEEKGFTSDD